MDPEKMKGMSPKDLEMMGVKPEQDNKPKSPDFSHNEAVWIEAALKDLNEARSADPEGLDDEQRKILGSLLEKVSAAVNRSVENDEQMQEALDLNPDEAIWVEEALKQLTAKRSRDPQGLDQEQKQTLSVLMKDITAMVNHNVEQDRKRMGL